MINVIPAIDLINGKCVRLTKGKFETAEFYSDPPEDLAKLYADVGAVNLHLVDLDGAREGKIINYRVLEKITNKTNLKVDFSGGISTSENLRIAFECGATQVCIGSLAVKDPKTVISWLETYGREKIIISADVKNELIAIKGWQESSEMTISQLLTQYVSQGGLEYCLSTDIEKDGTLSGPSFDLYKRLKDEFEGLKIIASGGIATVRDIEMLGELEIWGVVVGKALLNKSISPRELGKFYS
jgi:phosphoribosylformimino-5-aminoimidazole carboxamide ribotide isomerase